MQNIKYTFSLALRLTFWYAGIFTVSSLVAFSIFYFAMVTIVGDRTDEDLVEDVVEVSILLKEHGLTGLMAEIDTEVESEGTEKNFYRLIDAEGRVLLSTDLSSWPGLAPAKEIRQLMAGRKQPLLKTIEVSGHESHSRIVYGHVGKGQVLQIGYSLEDDDKFLAVFRNIFMVTLPVLMIVAGLLGWFMARKALKGVREVTAAAIDISKGDLTRRVPETNRGDDIDLLANTFNTMLDRIETLITGMRDMTDNIAHDLRSPLTRIRGIAETTLLNDPSIEDFKSVACNSIEECDRLLHMINTMLDITETEAGTISQTMEAVDLSTIIKDACELYQPLAEDKNIGLNCTSIERAAVKGNIYYLQRMIGNLLDNALKYTPSGGKVTLDLLRQDNDIVITISDNGIGIEATDLKNIFERFYRSDKSRSKTGTGLGLSLAQSIARAHRGNINVSSTLGAGSDFCVVIPILQK